MTQDIAAALPLHGVHVPLVTPFTRSGGIAAEALEALAHEVLDAGATGIVALGTTAEAAGLDEAERDLVTDVCARVCGERGALLTVGAGRAAPGPPRPRWPGWGAGRRRGRRWSPCRRSYGRRPRGCRHTSSGWPR
ncbi:dihydrodipicolinate synthase family protein [Streptomyces sp. MS1.HAVA.3]|uniref:Dihydrodipicolinate synthase family protein n=1 Tax=Streptomyces caledonius TaxID=3134107 RepID=A0ABU8U0F2_9ACTN